jgi:hypothetical protein
MERQIPPTRKIPKIREHPENMYLGHEIEITLICHHPQFSIPNFDQSPHLT